MNSNDLLKRHWTVKHDESELQFETLDAAIWYAAGAASVSNSVKQINTRLRMITLLPAQPTFEISEKCAA
ncbi:MAG: hypothetical protein C0469_08255 [Cyanobacteria bacterium DS2.3.42]|nr:hypothetical protein [Cyanobacteria bacterium DS2.3.42]